MESARSARSRPVRFTPNSGHSQCKNKCPLWAKSGTHAVQQTITSSARSRNASGISSPRALAVVSSVSPQRRARVVEVPASANVVLSNAPEIDLS